MEIYPNAASGRTEVGKANLSQPDSAIFDITARLQGTESDPANLRF